MGQNEQQKLFTVREAAVALKISEMTVRRLIKGGGLEAIRVGWQWRVRLPQILEARSTQ